MTPTLSQLADPVARPSLEAEEDTTVVRLLDLIAVLETVPEERFDMSFWWCGTVGCAAGWYVHMRPNCGISTRELQQCDMCEALAVLSEHFGITKKQAGWLFDLDAYWTDAEWYAAFIAIVNGAHSMNVTTTRVIARVRELLEERNK